MLINDIKETISSEMRFLDKKSLKEILVIIDEVFAKNKQTENERSPYLVSKDPELLFQLVYEQRLEIIAFSPIGVPFLIKMLDHLLLCGYVRTGTTEQLKKEMIEYCKNSDLCFIIPYL